MDKLGPVASMTLGAVTRKFRIVVQGDEEIWVIELPPEDSDTIGDVSLIVELIRAFQGQDLNYGKSENGPVEIYPPEDEASEESPDADSCAYVVCLTRPATEADAEAIDDRLRKWLRANGEKAEITIEVIEL